MSVLAGILCSPLCTTFHTSGKEISGGPGLFCSVSECGGAQACVWMCAWVYGCMGGIRGCGVCAYVCSCARARVHCGMSVRVLTKQLDKRVLI